MNQKPKVIVSAPVPPDLREQLAERCEIVEVPTGQNPGEVLDADARANIEGMVCTVRTKVDQALLDALPALRALGLFDVLEPRDPALRAWLSARGADGA